MAAPSDDPQNAEEAVVAKEGPAPSEVVGTLFIFDWDDTILPTTALALQGFALDGPDVDVNSDLGVSLAAHAQAWVDTLGKAHLHGKVVIVTAAERGWVEATCGKFLPGLVGELIGDDALVTVISARSEYEPQGYSDPLEWKQLAFAAAVQHYFPESCECNVVSVGDASYERRAILSLANWMPRCTPKSLKLLERPSLQTLSQECIFVRMFLEHLSSHPGPLDLCIRGQTLEHEQVAQSAVGPVERPHFEAGDTLQTVAA
jgi:hypothetical protein